MKPARIIWVCWCLVWVLIWLGLTLHDMIVAAHHQAPGWGPLVLLAVAALSGLAIRVPIGRDRGAHR